MLALGLSVSTALPGSAGAVTLMDLLRGGPGKIARDRGELPPAGIVTSPSGSSAGQSADASDPEPLPRVSGPRYYNYKADSARAVNTANFGEGLANLKFSATPEIAKALEAYYGAGGKTLWVSEGELTARANAVIAFLETVDESGLDPADYSISPPAKDVTASITNASGAAATATTVEMASAPVSDAYQRAQMQFELALSAKVLAYVQDTTRGRVDPNRLSGYHDFKRKTVNLAPVLKLAGLSPDVAAYLRSREPSSAEYLALKAELARLRDEGDAAHVVRVPADLLLKPGNSSADMANVVMAIEHRASPAFKTEHAAIISAYQQTPDYTPDLVDLVKAFQSENGLKPDGVIGRATVRAMVGESNDAKIAKVQVAMEQIRWLPADLGQRYVFINQPAFMAYYHNDGVEQFGMKVVVGSKANQTYFFQDQIQTVEFNPYWGVPQSIIVNEMLPKLRRDPSYLDRLGYEVQVGGRAVSSTSVNWYGSTNAVSVRQPPSSDNALGDLKILFPNAHAIYMHDTPAKSFFNRDMRALSHGCIRLVDPRRMAAAVLGTSVDKVGEQIASGKNRAVQVPEKIPVYVAYFTAWPDKDGKVQFFDDVYDRDSYVQKAFAVTTKARAASI
ncbi:murein L,D-transpeptidase [Agrobacterium salinitolerans]|uniref:Murein L,D-transpeptidase n=1 Tax=Agrobacterium salinitolerans TaxID=1183413 RepID=A0A9X3QZ27_9HYPH|nr:murein L,D-transpeptidase [Agrobacterium salinitolerans]MCZ7852807.1 murein L,D-transpeptidase [Agrobacterium salinitolerans]MCZ7890800.1 murein L,D-transpeptidase [Agrobacterium salinitolerans]MCZ7936475.1 murein L,D-transpeptidase [Agrobacterium salinitolerans]MCZ7974250.1 murein L,D-transpeptidase [Agrobacterium salinitolerans]